ISLPTRHTDQSGQSQLHDGAGTGETTEQRPQSRHHRQRECANREESMQRTFFMMVALATFGATGPAHAYCCWNPAICQAVCEAACCGANLTIPRPSSPQRLQSFSVQDLTRAQS